MRPRLANAQSSGMFRAESGWLIADRETGRAPDLSEHLAGKTALQKAGRTLAMRMLPKLIKQLPKATNEAVDKEIAE